MQTGKNQGHRWTKGKSGNPTGRPKLPDDFKEAVRECSKECVERLRFWASSGNPSASVAAAKVLLAYAYGNPPDFVTVANPNQVIEVKFASDDSTPAATPSPAPDQA